jgi:hypothetical protein
MQALPAVLHEPFKGTQVPAAPALPLQLPLQHCAELVQAWLSDVHCVEPHPPPLQTKVQQSCGTVQELPDPLQGPDAQTFTCESQAPEQQSTLAPQTSPRSRHEPPPVAPAVPVPPGPLMPSTLVEPQPTAQTTQTKNEMTAAQTSFLTPPPSMGLAMPTL